MRIQLQIALALAVPGLLACGSTPPPPQSPYTPESFVAAAQQLEAGSDEETIREHLGEPIAVTGGPWSGMYEWIYLWDQNPDYEAIYGLVLNSEGLVRITRFDSRLIDRSSEYADEFKIELVLPGEETEVYTLQATADELEHVWIRIHRDQIVSAATGDSPVRIQAGSQIRIVTYGPLVEGANLHLSDYRRWYLKEATLLDIDVAAGPPEENP